MLTITLNGDMHEVMAQIFPLQHIYILTLYKDTQMFRRYGYRGSMCCNALDFCRLMIICASLLVGKVQ